MGASQSAAPPAAPTLSDLEPDEARCMMRNLQLLASRDLSEPGRFCRADWLSVLSAMPPRLAEGLWRGLVGDQSNAAAGSLGLDDIVRTIVPLRAGHAQAIAAHEATAFPDGTVAAMVASEDAAPWLASIGKASSGDSSSHVIADAACAIWMIDLRELEPLPALCEGKSRLLGDKGHLRFLARALPAGQRREWRLLFTTQRDGTSFTRLVALCANRTPVLIVVRSKSGDIFGAYASQPLVVSSQFGGGYGSFVFSLAPGAPTIHQASGDNANLVYLNTGMDVLPNGLAFGGNLEAQFFGLWIRDDLETGRSDGPCSTFAGAPCLASSSSFEIDEIEVWAVEPDPPPPSEEELAAQQGENALTAAGVLSSKHQETRNFLQMAGRKAYAEDIPREE